MSAVVFVDAAPAAIAALEEYAGASDQDRAAWLAERHGGITATQVRDLYMRKLGRSAYTDQQELIDQKLGRAAEEDISHVPVVGWGNEREPVIAARLEREELLLPETRVFRHPDNARYLASPDGLGVDLDGGLLVSEIKTAAYDLPPGSERFDAKGYLFQVQWVMFVTGASLCRFVVEERIREADGSFSPGPEHRYWIRRDDAVIAELVATAEDFLAELDRQREEGAPVADPGIDALAAEVLTGRVLEADGKKRKEAAWGSLLARLSDAGEALSQLSETAKVSFSPGAESVVEVPDEDAAREAHPKEWAALQRAVNRAEKLTLAWGERQAEFVKKETRVGKPKLTITRGKKGKKA